MLVPDPDVVGVQPGWVPYRASDDQGIVATAGPTSSSADYRHMPEDMPADEESNKLQDSFMLGQAGQQQGAVADTLAAPVTGRIHAQQDVANRFEAVRQVSNR